MSDVLAISPQQAKSSRIKAVPTAVIESFNELIVENLNGNTAIVKQKDAVIRIQSKLNQTLGDQYTSQQICDRGWLNVEDIYRLAGWRVTYDKPGYNESYDATFEFTVK